MAATRGNHGLGLAWAGRRLGTPVTVCVPIGNNPEKNAAVLGLGARLVEEGRDYDESVAAAERLVREGGLHLVHSTNDATVVAGAGTLTLEMLEEEPGIEALVFSVGGGSQAVGGLTVARARKPGVPVYGVQAAGASAIHDAWHLGRPVSKPSADTFADGLATRNTYPFTFGALREGLAGFVTVTDAEIADALRLVLSTTHTLVEGAGAAGLAGLLKLRETLAGKTVGIVLSGANIDRHTLAASADARAVGNRGSGAYRPATRSSVFRPRNARIRSTTSPTTLFGVEAPAVRPTVTGPSGSQPSAAVSPGAPTGRWRSVAPWIRSAPLMW